MLSLYRAPIAVALVLVGATLVALTAGPVGSAVEIGGDEGMEVAKGFLWEKGVPLYHPVWDDQPPIYTVIMGVMFAMFGTKITVARILAVSYSTLLLGALFSLVKRRSGSQTALLSMLFFLGTPGIFELCVSAMLELPATATAILAIWALDKFHANQTKKWLFLSSLLFALALQTKLTSVIFLPIIICHIIHDDHAPCIRDWRAAVLRLLYFGSICAAVFCSIGFLCGEDYQQMWRSHFSGTTLATNSPSNAPFHPTTLLDYPGAVGGTIATVLFYSAGRLRGARIPMMMLATAAVIHSVHRPYWGYYRLHFAVPMAWASALSVRKAFSYAWRDGHFGHLLGRHFTPFAGLLSGALLLSSLLLDGTENLVDQVLRLRALERVQNNPLIMAMRPYATYAKSIYARDGIYAFHAGVPSLPELAVLPLKRFWSRQITEHAIQTIVASSLPDLLLLDCGSQPPAWEKITRANYRQVYSDQAYVLYVLRRVNDGIVPTTLSPNPLQSVSNTISRQQLPAKEE